LRKLVLVAVMPNSMFDKLCFGVKHMRMPEVIS
jgi:hypothetical protein